LGPRWAGTEATVRKRIEQKNRTAAAIAAGRTLSALEVLFTSFSPSGRFSARGSRQVAEM
jgi:hypothetical protein